MHHLTGPSLSQARVLKKIPMEISVICTGTRFVLITEPYGNTMLPF